MLVLPRKAGEWVWIGPPETGFLVKVLSIDGRTVRLGVQAPPEVKILRGPQRCDERGRPPGASGTDG